MAEGVSVQFDDKELRKKVKRVQDSIGSRKMMEGIGLRHLKWVDDNFRREGNGAWPPLSPNTIASKRARGSALTMLQDTGTSRIRQSFDMKVAFLGAKVTVGTTNRIAKYHHFGTRPYSIRPRRKKMLRFFTTNGWVLARHVKHPGLPARPLIPTEKVGKDLAIKLIDAFLVQAARG